MFFSFLFGITMIGFIASRVLSRKWMAEWKENNGVLGVILAWSMFVFVVALIVAIVLLIVDDSCYYIPWAVLNADMLVMWVSIGVSILTMFAMATVADVRRKREERKGDTTRT